MTQRSESSCIQSGWMHRARTFLIPTYTRRYRTKYLLFTPLITSYCKMSSKSQPQWLTPTNLIEEPVLHVHNSLTRSKDRFIPINGRNVSWYSCGPTVYDVSHVGHARNYVTQDILRRILTDYFGYNVHFVMNITDIDDKIIQRSRRNYLLKELISKTTLLSPQLIDQVKNSWTSYFNSQLSKGLPSDKKPPEGQEIDFFPEIVDLSERDAAWKLECIARDEKFGMHLTALQVSYSAIKASEVFITKDSLSTASQAEAHKLIEASRDILAPALDAQYGDYITDQSIFKEHTVYWENEFMKDMRQLRVLPPDTLTRVTEFVEEIVEFVKILIDRGFAYELDGSVYFDTRAYDNAKGHTSMGEEADWHHVYLKLEPWSKGNRTLMQEGEGALTQASSRYDADFALWKAAKPGEPSWPSIWGPGRPGWHIECSVMASDVLGPSLDIHSGGSDLAFPHHDNEIAQSEAYHDCRQWVNYFLHTGQLHIEGLKMSKSLKNYITIGEVLQRYTPRQLRLAFMRVPWNARMDFQEAVMKGEVRGIETFFDNFFTNVKALIAQTNNNKSYRPIYKEAERDLADQLIKAQQAFREALCDSFNTQQALAVLQVLVTKSNIYISQSSNKHNINVLSNVARWVTKMLWMFGLGEGPYVEGSIGWGESVLEGQETSGDREATLMPYLQVFSTFRDNVRSSARQDAPLKQILDFCDRLRDVDLIPLGVALDDQEDGKALVKLVPAATLRRLRDEKTAAAEAKAVKKAELLAAERQKKLAKLESGKIPPNELFKPPNVEPGVYGSWDDDGLPLTDGTGVEINKSQQKKLRKRWELQLKLHADWEAFQKEQKEERSEK